MAARSRRTVARHATLPTPSPIGQILAVVAVSVVVVLVAAAGVVGYTALTLQNNIATNAVELVDQPEQPPALGPYDGAFNVMIVGTDECEEQFRAAFGGRCSGPDADGQLNDVNLLIHVSANPRRVTAISFPRDLMIPIPSCTDEDGTELSARSKEQINAAYGLGGLSCVVDTVSDLSGLSIPFAAKVSFGNVINITDAIGGVEVCIGNGGIRDSDTGIDWPAGLRNVQGMDALQFLRTRHGVGDGSDLARIGNQQQYLSRLVRKIRSDAVLSDPATVLRLASTASRNVTPSQSLADPIRMAQLALTLKDVPFEDITFVQYPVLGDPSDPNKVVPDQRAATALWDALAQNRPLELTGQAGANGGVIVTPPTDEPQPDPSASDPSATPGTGGESIALPESISGTTANEQTCSAGNVRE